MSVKIRIKRNRVYLDIIQNRKHHWESLHINLSSERSAQKEQLKLAELCRAKREMQIVCGEWDFPQKSALTLSAYINKKALSAKSQSRQKAFLALCAHILRFSEDLRLTQISAQWLIAFREHLFQAASLKPASAAAYFALLKTALNTAEQERLIAKNPAREIKPLCVPQCETEKSTLSADEVNRLLTAPKCEKRPDISRAFLFALFTALRFSDLQTLSWSDIKEQNGVFFLKKQQVKTKRTVEIPLCQTALSLLGLRDRERVFNLASYSTCLKYLRSWAKSCGIKQRLSWHTARRTFATLALEQNIDVFTIQRLMGHTKITTTALYAKSDGIKKRAVEQLETAMTKKINFFVPQECSGLQK